MKKVLSVFLAIGIVFALVLPGTAAPVAASSADAANAMKSSEIRGMLVSFFYRFFDLFYRLSAVTIQKTAPLPDKTTPAGGIPAVDPAQPVIQAETWRAFELTLTAANHYDDPFSDVTLDLLLIGDGKQYTIPAFWDGGNVWKVRAACPQAGAWYYKTVCSDASDVGLHNKTGRIEFFLCFSQLFFCSVQFRSADRLLPTKKRRSLKPFCFPHRVKTKKPSGLTAAGWQNWIEIIQNGSSIAICFLS